MHISSRVALTASCSLILGLPLVARAADVSTTAIADITQGITTVVNSYLVPIIFTIALLVFLFGVAKAYILTNSETERAKGHQIILWAVVGFAVMLSVWGLVNLLTTTFGLKGSSTTSPTPPTIKVTTS